MGAQTCPTEGSEQAQVAAVEENGDLLLADGRVAALAGFAADGETFVVGAARGQLAGAQVRIIALAHKPDRWGRLPAAVFLGETRENVAERLLAAGLGLYRPDAAARPCRDRLLAAERGARSARSGLWARPGALLDAGDARGVLAASKGLAVVEGRVFSIGERRGRLYLNFGQRRTSDFAIVIAKRNLAMFETTQLRLRQLAGRRLRARGLIDRGFGPIMEIASPDALEVLDQGAGAAEAGQ